MLEDSYGMLLQVEYGLLNVLQTKMYRFHFASNDFLSYYSKV